MSLTALERRQLRALLAGRSDESKHRSNQHEAIGGTGAAARRAVFVVSAHPWAGASEVALAMADLASRRLAGVVLVDAAERPSSGLIGVTEREFGQRQDGWSVGRRGDVELRRHVTADLQLLDHSVTRSRGGAIVVDAGPCVADRAAGPARFGDDDAVVLVCRATIPGFRATEVALSRLGQLDRSALVLAAVGVRRLSGVVRGSAGPLLHQLNDRGRLVCFPYVRRLEVEGLDDRPLPSVLLSSAADVWARLPNAATPGEPSGGMR